MLRSGETEFRYERKHQPYPRMGAWREELDRVLSANAVKLLRERLTLIRMFFVRVYPRGSQEMVFDAHDRAFAFFRGACTRGIYDNTKTTVDGIFIGRDRR